MNICQQKHSYKKVDFLTFYTTKLCLFLNVAIARKVFLKNNQPIHREHSKNETFITL